MILNKVSLQNVAIILDLKMSMSFRPLILFICLAEKISVFKEMVYFMLIEPKVVVSSVVI